jgi:hypothetical protein
MAGSSTALCRGCDAYHHSALNSAGPGQQGPSCQNYAGHVSILECLEGGLWALAITRIVLCSSHV